MAVDPTLEKVITIVKNRLPPGYELAEAQIVGLQAAWEKKAYREYSSYRRTAGHLANVMGPIYGMLTESFGFAVRKNNFRQVIESLILGRVFYEEDPNSPPVYGTAPEIEFFVGRETEKEIVDREYAKQKTIFIYGNEGIGKTSITADFFQKINKTGNFQKYVWHVSSEIEIEKDILEINRVVGCDRTSTPITDFLNFIAVNRILVVIDGIDLWILNHLEEFNGFIRRLISLHHKSLIMMTARNTTHALKILQKQGNLILNLKIDGLSNKASKELFSFQGIESRKIDLIIDSSRGNPSIILDICEKIKLLNGDINQYIKNKTLFAASSERERLNYIFSNPESKIQEREKRILSHFIFDFQENSILVNDFTKAIDDKSKYSLPEILEAIEILDSNGLISIQTTLNSVKLVKHDEVRGYLLQDPLNLFKFT